MAANARGEVTIQTKDGPRRLKFTFNALCDLEEETGLGFNELMEKLQAGGRFTLVRTVVRVLVNAGRALHEPPFTAEQAGDLIDAAGGIGPFSVQFNAAMAAGMGTGGEPAGDPAGDGPGNAAPPAAA